MTGVAFLYWLKRFYVEVKRKGHLGLEAAKFAAEYDIILYCLLPNATHLMQPCDVGVMGPVKTIYNQEVRKFQMEGEANCYLTKHYFPKVRRKKLCKIISHVLHM